LSASLYFGAINAATKLVAPPAGKPTSMRTGFTGYSCARAIGIAIQSASPIASGKAGFRGIKVQRCVTPRATFSSLLYF